MPTKLEEKVDLRNTGKGNPVESCQCTFNTDSTTLSWENKYFTCSLKKNNAREKNLAVLDLWEMVQYTQSMCAIFCGWFKGVFEDLTIHDDFRT